MSNRHESVKFPIYLIIIFVILSIGILTTGYLYYKNQGDYITKEKQQELAAIITLKIDQLSLAPGTYRLCQHDYGRSIPCYAGEGFYQRQNQTPPQKQISERFTSLASFHIKV